MNSEDNSIPFESIESDIIKELYKKTPLKKRPIQPSSLSPDEKKITPKPRACTVPEGRLSKRKMLKPTKKLIDSYVESTSVLEQATKAMYVPVIKTSTESKASTPVEMNNKAVNMAMAMAIPELKKTCVKTVVPSRTSRSSKALCNRNLTKQERDDFYMAIELQKEEFNLRERRPIRILSPEIRVRFKRRRSHVKTEDTSTESMDSNSISSQEMNNEIEAKKTKQEIKRMPKKAAGTIRKNNKDAFSGSHMYILSPELANIVGHQKMSSGAIIDAMHYVFLERNLFEADKKYVICDDELSEKLFAGKRRLRFADVKNYLHKHLTLSD